MGQATPVSGPTSINHVEIPIDRNWERVWVSGPEFSFAVDPKMEPRQRFFC